MIPLFRELIVELNSDCNRDCFFCPRHSDNTGHRKFHGKKIVQFMPTELVQKILGEAKEMGFKGYVTFHHFSEPFLDPRLIEFAKLAKLYGMHPFEHTNGDLLRKNDELCEQVKETFAHIVVGLYDHCSEEEREEQKKFWLERLAGMKVLFSCVDDVFVRSHYTEKNLDGFQSKKGIRPSKPKWPNGKCSNPGLKMLIHYTGKMALCCEDMCEEFDLGSAHDTSIWDLWYSEKHVKIYQNLQEGKRHMYPLCSQCPITPF